MISTFSDMDETLFMAKIGYLENYVSAMLKFGQNMHFWPNQPLPAERNVSAKIFGLVKFLAVLGDAGCGVSAKNMFGLPTM